MRILIKLAFMIGLLASYHLVWADRVGGSARADFGTDELSVPCVQIANFEDDAFNDLFFDIILERRGNSFNYELTFAESEDQAHCQRVADFAAFDDDDFDDGESGANNILVSCELRSDRSKISVDGKNLAVGDYSSTVTSGSVSVSSPVKSSVGDEVEFDYDSSPDDIAAGATEIGADFIQNGAVDADIIDASDNVVASVSNVMCSIRD